MTTSHPTAETYPSYRRGYQSGPDQIIGLGIFGTGIVLSMLAEQDEFTFGSAGACDLRADRKYLAPAHARIERVKDSRANVRIINISSGKNDIVRLGQVAEAVFVMAAGEWFEIGDSRYFAMNKEMQLARLAVMEGLGIRRHAAIDDLLIASIQDSARHVLLEGEPGCDQERLGRIIHQVSHRRHNRFHVLPDPQLDEENRSAIRDACNGTVLVNLHRRGALSRRLVEALVRPSAKLRLIICAHSANKAKGSFSPVLVHDAKKIQIPPLRERMDEINELLDRWLIARRSELRVSLLPPDLRKSLQAHTWPGNLAELRETADHLASLAHSSSERQAARLSEHSLYALRTWFSTMKLKPALPLLPEEATPEPTE